jgi:acyl-CoA synthetase (NDP forming)
MVVIGASHDMQKPGAMLLSVLKNSGFKGPVAGVNPRGGEIHGIPLYPALAEVPFPIELAVLLIPPQAVPAAVRECAQKGAKGVVISSEGFAESGAAGRQYQEEVRAVLQTSGVRGFGPNTMGIVNTETGLTTAYFANERMLKPGAVGFAAQSGIFVGALLRYLSSFDILRVSKVLGLGNKVDVNESDALEYLMGDDQTRIVGMYLEDIRDGRRFLETARRAVREKPVLVVKGGRTPAGAEASASHTASLAVDDRVLEGALHQAGVLRMRGIEDLMAAIIGFRCMPLPRGERIALVTYSGAQAIMSIDAGLEEGLGLARFTKKTQERLARVIATPSKMRNPIDIYPDMMAHGFEKTTIEIMRGLLEDDGVHGVVFISFAMFGPDMYRPLVSVVEENRNKPVFFCLLGPAEDVVATKAFLEAHRIPFYLFPETAVRVFANMWRYARIAGAEGRQAPPEMPVIREAPRDG